MIKYKEVAFTVYAVTNMRKARQFYEGKLGLVPSRELNPNFIEYDLGPHTLAVGCAPEMWKPSPKGTTVALEVVDFDQAVAELKQKRVPFAIPPMDFPLCRMLGVRDPDKNLIVLHQRKSAAERRAATRSQKESTGKSDRWQKAKAGKK